MMKNMLLRLIFSGIGCCFISVAENNNTAMDTFRDDTKRNSPATFILRNSTSCFTTCHLPSLGRQHQIWHWCFWMSAFLELLQNISGGKERSLCIIIESIIFCHYFYSHVVGKQKLLTSLVFSLFSTALYLLISAASHVTPKTAVPSKWPAH